MAAGLCALDLPEAFLDAGHLALDCPHSLVDLGDGVLLLLQLFVDALDVVRI